jgi:hypothetical protein
MGSPRSVLLADNLEDLLRVAGSLATGAVRASDALRVPLGRDGAL